MDDGGGEGGGGDGGDGGVGEEGGLEEASTPAPAPDVLSPVGSVDPLPLRGGPLSPSGFSNSEPDDKDVQIAVLKRANGTLRRQLQARPPRKRGGGHGSRPRLFLISSRGVLLVRPTACVRLDAAGSVPAPLPSACMPLPPPCTPLPPST